MKNLFYPLACCVIAGALTSCGGGKKNASTQEEQSSDMVTLGYSKSLKAADTDSLQLPIDKDG